MTTTITLDRQASNIAKAKALHEPRASGPFRDLIQCPACSFIAMYDAAIAKATGAA